jgi:hypothetical protein
MTALMTRRATHFAALTTAGATALTAVSVAPAGAEPTKVTEDPFAALAAPADNPTDAPLAPTIEESGLYSPDEIAASRQKALASLNRIASEDYGPFTAERAATLGRSNYYEDQDINVFVIPAPEDDAALLAVPLHVTVFADGSVTFEDGPNAEALGQPIFEGPWGNEVIIPLELTLTDDGGLNCGGNQASLLGRYTRRLLNDSSSNFDYLGISLSAVSEITVPDPFCDDYLDFFFTEMSARDATNIYAAQDPLSDFDGDCGPETNLSVGGSFGGINAGISQSFKDCDKYDVYGGNASNATELYGIQFDNNGNCNAESRETLQMTVIRVPQDAKNGWLITFRENGDVDSRPATFPPSPC